MLKTKKKRLFLIKIAAIGDISITCHALKLLSQRFDLHNLYVHWVIDADLKPLAQTLLTRDDILQKDQVQWIAIPSRSFFLGSFLKKCLLSLKIFIKRLLAFPHATIIMHRDVRYRRLIKPKLFGFEHVFWLSRSTKKNNPSSELELCFNLFNEMAQKLQLHQRAKSKTSSCSSLKLTSTRNFRIAFLIGGGQNSKTTFLEKRWPFFVELVQLFLKNTDAHLFLLGSREDRALEEFHFTSLLKFHPDRITNLLGQMKLEEYPSFFQTINGLVSPDSGIAHLAHCSMENPDQFIVTLFGPTDPKRWAPSRIQLHHEEHSPTCVTLYQSLPCAPCYQEDGLFKACLFEAEQYQKCMKAITVNHVFETVSQLLKS